MSLTIETKLDPLEVGGEKVQGLPQDADVVSVKAHRIYNSLVLIEFQGKQITVVAEELRRAIQNATNH